MGIFVFVIEIVERVVELMFELAHYSFYSSNLPSLQLNLFPNSKFNFCEDTIEIPNY